MTTEKSLGVAMRQSEGISSKYSTRDHIVGHCVTCWPFARYGVPVQLQTEPSHVICKPAHTVYINTVYYTGRFLYSGTALAAIDDASAVLNPAQFGRVKSLYNALGL